MGKPVGAKVRYENGLYKDVEVPDTYTYNPYDTELRILYDYSHIQFPSKDSWGMGIWRYSQLLPFDVDNPLYPLHVGSTPLVHPTGLKSYIGVSKIYIKDETRGPSSSNKDRATALVLEYALRTGKVVATCASTGNVAVSLSVGGAACNIRVVVCVPAQVTDAKLSYMLAAGAAVVKVHSGYTDAFRLSRYMAKQFGWMDRNTGMNPLTIEAKKTVAYEIWEQLGHIPDCVVVPVGDGPSIIAIHKGFWELKECGLVPDVPRFIGVQSEGCKPLVDAWERGTKVEEVKPNTIADGIAVGLPVFGETVLQCVKESDGALVAVSDSEIIDAIKTVARYSGIIPEPASAAGFAGAKLARERGYISQNDSVVIVHTGSGFKSPHVLPSAGLVTEVPDFSSGVEHLSSLIEKSDW
jgi:threonine synthase